MECRFCKIIAHDGEQIIHDTKYALTVLSNPRLMPGHLLVIPKRHVERLSELTKEERDGLLEEVVNVQEKILNSFAKGCDICQNFRPFIPDSKLKVSHLHFHLRPRELDDELYQKSQIHEKEIFRDIEEGEWEKYRELFKD